MKITVLGFWGGFPYAGGATTSYLIQSGDYTLLLDAGSGSLLSLEELIDPCCLDSVLLTHYHEDHIADLGVLQYYRQLMPSDEPKILPIYGHMEDIEHFSRLTLNQVSQGVGYQEVDELEIGPFRCRFLRTVHPVPCFAVRLEEITTGDVLVFTADTGYFPELIRFCQGADILITDTYFMTGHENHHAHLTTKETAWICDQAEVGQVILSHLRQDIDLSALKTETEYFLTRDIPVLLAKKHLLIES